MKNKNAFSRLLGRIALSVAALQTASAQEARDKVPADTSEKVTVMDPFKVVSSGTYVATNAIGATRIATPIQELPISVNIVTDSLMKDRDVQKIEDAIMYTSGVGNVNRNDAGTRNENFAIRGFNSNLVLRNGIPYNVFSDASNIVQIEVVKGANSVLYGVNSPGGLVNFVTKQPTSTSANEVRATVGSFGFKRGEVDSGGPVGSNAFRYRLNMAQESTDGPLRNQWERMTFVNPVVAVDLTPKTTLTFDYEYRELMGHFFRDAYPQLRHDASGVRDGYAAAGRNYSAMYPDDQNSYVTENLEARLQQRFSEHLTLRVVAADTTSKQDSYNMIGALMNIGSPNLLVRRNLLELNRFENRTVFADLAAEFSLGPTAHRLVTGAQWTKNDTSGAGAVGAGVTVDINDPHPDYFRPESRTQLLNALTPADYYFTETVTKSVFLIDQITLLDNKAHVLLGVRYDNLGVANGGTNTTPQVGLTYAIRPGVNLYATYSESFVPNPPQVLDGHFPNQITTFPPETGKGYEAGVKFDLRDSTISGTIALFSITRSNVLQIQANAADPLKADAVLSGEQKSEGVEIDIAGKVTPQYSIVASYSNTNARVTVDAVTPAQVGLRLEGVARNQAAIWNSYRFGSGRFGGLVLGAGVLYRQGPIQHLVLRTTEAVRQGTYTTAEAAVSYEFKYGGREWRAALNVHNLTDEDYFDRRSQKALPRNYLLSLGVKY